MGIWGMLFGAIVAKVETRTISQPLFIPIAESGTDQSVRVSCQQISPIYPPWIAEAVIVFANTL